MAFSTNVFLAGHLYNNLNLSDVPLLFWLSLFLRDEVLDVPDEVNLRNRLALSFSLGDAVCSIFLGWDGEALKSMKLALLIGRSFFALGILYVIVLAHYILQRAA